MGATQFRENHYLNKEYAERMAAQQNLQMGNYTGAQSHDMYANQYGMKADQTHSTRYQRGKTMMPFAQHGPSTMGGGLLGGLGSGLGLGTGLGSGIGSGFGAPIGAPLGLPMASSSMFAPTVSTTYISPPIESYSAPIVSEFVGQPSITTYEHIEPAGGLGFMAPTTMGGAGLSNYW